MQPEFRSVRIISRTRLKDSPPPGITAMIDKPMNVTLTAIVFLIVLLANSPAVFAQPVDQDLKEDCERSSSLSGQYNCDCYAREFVKTEAKMAKEGKTKSHPLEEKYLLEIEKAEAKGQTDRAEMLKKTLEKSRKSFAASRPNKSEVRLAMAENPVCLDRAVIRQSSLEECVDRYYSQSDELKKATSMKEYCSCVGDEFSELAMSEGKVLNSKHKVKLGSQADLKCYNKFTGGSNAASGQSNIFSGSNKDTTQEPVANPAKDSSLPDSVPDAEKLLNEGKKLFKGLFN